MIDAVLHVMNLKRGNYSNRIAKNCRDKEDCSTNSNLEKTKGCDMRVLSRDYLFFALLIVFSFLLAEESVFAQSNVVTVASEAALRDAMAMGGLVVCSFDGTITLSNAIDVTRDVTLDAHGHSVAISGNNSNRIFTVASGVNFSATNVVFANGRN